MGTVQNIQSSFSEGRISPRLHGQIDIPSYKTSVKTLENFIVLPQGSATRRPGTYFVNGASTNTSSQSKLIPYYYGQGQSYVLEFYADNIKLFSNNGILATYATKDDTSPTQFSIGSTGYTATQIADIKFIQSADVLFIAHPDHPPKKLERTIPESGETGYSTRAEDGSYWALSNIDFLDGPYDEINLDDTKRLKLSVPSGVVSSVNTTDNEFTSNGHGLSDNDAIHFTAPSGFPTGLAINTTYYVINSATNTFKVSTTSGGGVLGITGTGSGVITWLERLDYVEIGGVGVDTALNAFVNSSHGLQAGMKIYIHKDSLTGVGNLVTDDAGAAFDFSGGSTPTATATSQGNSTLYYVVNPTATTFQITTTKTNEVLGSPITFKLSGTNTKWTGKLNVVKMILKKDRTSVKLTASGTSHTPFTTSDTRDVGVIYRINVLAGTDKDKIKGIRWASIKITSVSSTTVALGTLQEDCVLDDANTIEWNAGVFNTTNGYPRDVSIYQQRLVFAGIKKYPATVWFSKTGDFFNFASSELLGSSTGNIDPTGAIILGEQILDDNALTFTIDSDTVDKIQWMSEGTKLAVGTTGGVFTIYGSENDLTLTPFNFTIRKESAYPAGSADAMQIGQRMLYVQQNERKIREMATEGEEQQEYGAMNLTLRSEDITYSGVKELTYQEQPFSVVWGRLGNGKLIALTHENSLNMYAWSTHTIGGTFDNNIVETSDAVKIAVTNFTGDGLTVSATITITSYSSLGTSDYFILTDKDGVPKTFNCGGAGPTGTDHDTWMQNESNDTTADNIFTMLNEAGNEAWTVANPAANVVTITRDRNVYDDNAVVESIVSIPQDNRTQTWMIVKRTINSLTKRHIEYMERFHDAQEIEQEDAHFVDCGLKTYNVTAFTSASGYDHLEGQSLLVLGDGAIQPNSTISSGSITLGVSTNTLVAGLPYTSELITLPMTMGDGGGSFVIGNKRMIKINMKMLNGLGLKFAMEGQDYEEIIFRNPSEDLYGNMVPLFSGNKEMAPIARSFESEGVSFKCEEPFPFTILYIAQQFEVNLG